MRVLRVPLPLRTARVSTRRRAPNESTQSTPAERSGFRPPARVETAYGCGAAGRRLDGVDRQCVGRRARARDRARGAAARRCPLRVAAAGTSCNGGERFQRPAPVVTAARTAQARNRAARRRADARLPSRWTCRVRQLQRAPPRLHPRRPPRAAGRHARAASSLGRSPAPGRRGRCGASVPSPLPATGAGRRGSSPGADVDRDGPSVGRSVRSRRRCGRAPLPPWALLLCSG